MAGIGRRIGDTLRVPHKGVHRLLLVLVVLAMAAAIGGTIAISAPGVFGFGRSADAAATPDPTLPALAALPPDAPHPSAAGVAAALDPQRRGLGEFAGTVVDPATGAVLWDSAAGEALLPGSTQKLVTGAAALLTLDVTQRFTTKVVAGPDPGTVVLVGGGDPTLSARPAAQSTFYPAAPHLDDLVDAVKKAMPGKIDRVLVDTSRWAGPTMAPGWDRSDIDAGYITPIEPVMLDGGRIDPLARDGARVEEPALVAGRELARRLGADPARTDTGKAGTDAAMLGQAQSAPVADLVEFALRESDNVLAETLAREVAVARDAEPSFAGAAAASLEALRQAGFDPTGAVAVDGSGLSTQDRVSPRLLAGLLAAGAAPAAGPRDTQFLRTLVSGLPVAGGDGTLDDRFDGTTGRGVVRAKTGTLTRASSLAGTVVDADGRLLVFAFMSNGAATDIARARLDVLAGALARCGCR